MQTKYLSVIKNLTMILTLLFISSGAFSETPEEKAFRISLEGDLYDKGFGNTTSSSQMTLRNKQGEETIRNFRVKTLEVENDGDKTLFIFDSPKDVKGTASLTFTHKIDSDDQWLYLPALKRVKRITSDNRSGSFVGSEFAYEDLGSTEIEKYNKRIFLKDEICPNTQENMCHVIKRSPTEKSSGYSYQVLWLDHSQDHKVWKIDFYDRKEALLKTLTLDDYNIYENKYWRAGKFYVINHQTGKSTELIISNYKFKSGLTEKDFNQRALARIR